MGVPVSRCCAIIVAFAAVCLAVQMSQPAGAATPAPPPGSMCNASSLATPRSDGRPIPDYPGIVKARIQNCYRQLQAVSPTPKDSAWGQHVDQCNPSHSHTSDMSAYETLVDCISYVPGPKPAPSVAFKAALPTIYLFASPATANSVSGVDNSAALLLWTVAEQMQADFFPKDDVLFVPEPSWASTDFNTQCLGDSTSTLGAIDLSSWTASSSADSWLLVNNGWTHTAYTASVLDCSSDGAKLSRAYSASGHSYRNQFTFLPLFLYWTYRKAASSSDSLSTGVLAGLVAAGTSTQIASVTVGNVGPVVTAPRAYIDSAQHLDDNIILLCPSNASGSTVNSKLCDSLKDSHLTKAKRWHDWGQCPSTNEALLARPFC